VIVESTDVCQSTPPTVSTSASSTVNTWSHTPSRAKRACRFHAVCHCPNSADRSRHADPVRYRHTPPPPALAHSRIVLHEFYEFLLDRGQRPLISPVPHSRRRERGQLREFPHHNPLEGFDRPRRHRKRYDPPDPKGVPRHLSERHYEQVWAELTCDRDRALIKVATDCGARPTELLAMTGADIDWGDALVHVLRKGGARTQWRPVSRDAIIWLRRYHVGSGYVGRAERSGLAARPGERRAMTYGAYRAVFSRINRRLGTNWTPHHLRHTARVRILDAGMALHEVQEIMGHRHLTAFITNTRGGHVGRGSCRDAMKIDRHHGVQIEQNQPSRRPCSILAASACWS